MAAVAAYLATITVGGQAIHDIDNFEMPFQMDTEETTSFSQAAPGTKTFLPTLMGMEFKISGRWNLSDAAQQALENAFFLRTLAAIVCTPGSSKTYTFSAWITEYPIKGAVAGLVEVEYSLLMNGDVVRG